MIHTVFCSSAAMVERPWQAELLGFTWARARQPGELIHLVARRFREAPACHPLASTLETESWSPHPYTGDLYPPYQKAAALMEWLFVQKKEGTVLVLEPTCVFRSPVATELTPGRALATAWPELPRGDGPFGLEPGFEFLTEVCRDRTLVLPAVTLPVLIHSTDLRKIVVRWLELMSIIRAETASATGPLLEADRLAYVIAAAEADIPHAVAELGASTGAGILHSEASLLDYRRPIPSLDGKMDWDSSTDGNGADVQPDAVKPGLDREFLGLLAELRERSAIRDTHHAVVNFP